MSHHLSKKVIYIYFRTASVIEDLNEKAVNEPYILLYKSMGQSSQTVVEWACKFHIAEFNMSPIFFNGLDQGCFALRENIFIYESH